MMTIDTVTKRHYERASVALSYTHFSEIFLPEQVIFEKFSDSIDGKAVLDIGCGGGRTTEALKKRPARYVGLDYSEKMIAFCKERYKGLEFLECDSSDMSIFPEETFDFVLFAGQGLDCMSHAKRLKTLAESYRLLKRGGVFAFSAHNRDDTQIVSAIDRGEPLTLKGVLRNVRYLLSYIKVRNGEVRAETYDILSDPLAGFGQLTYYITKRDQVRQLEAAGFREPEVFNWEGELVSADAYDSTSHWLYYACRK